MGTPKAGGTNVYATDTAPAAADLVDFLETQLVAAGWTIQAGAATDAVTFRSGQTPNGSYGARVVTSVSSGVLRLKYDTYAGGAAQTNYFASLNPDGVSDWRILANQYGFTMFEQGSNGTHARKWCLFSLLYVPSDISGDSTCQAIGLSDSHAFTTNPTGTLRDQIYKDQVYCAFITVSAGVLEENYNDSEVSSKGAPRWGNIAQETTFTNGLTLSLDEKWFNGDPAVQVASMYFGSPTWETVTPTLQGYVFDMIIVVGQARAERDELTFDSDTYVVFGSASATRNTCLRLVRRGPR